MRRVSASCLRLFDQVEEFDRAAGAGAEGFAVGAVDCAEADVFQRCFAVQARFACAAEDFFEMVVLGLADDVEDEVGVGGLARGR